MSWTSLRLSKLPELSYPVCYHSATVSADRDIIIFGGYEYFQEKPTNTTYILNTSQSNGIIKPHISGSTPPPMYGHTSTQIGRKMFVIGGNLGGDDGQTLNEVYQLNTSNLSWSKPRATGDAPVPRYGHSTIVLFDSYLLVFGGYNKSKGPMNDIHIFNTERNQWTKLPQRLTQNNVISLGEVTGTTPPLTPKDSTFQLLPTVPLVTTNTTSSPSTLGRGRSSTVSSLMESSSNNSSPITGWASTSMESKLSLTPQKTQLDLYEMYNRPISGNSSSSSSSSSNNSNLGESMIQPSCRYFHSCNIIGTKGYLFGGYDGQSLLNDLYILDLETLEWSKPTVQGDHIPSPRCGHSSITIGNKLYVFGGTIQMDPQQSVVSSQLHCDNELYQLDTDTLQWTLIRPHGILPSPRSGHICLAIQSRLVVIGGSEGILNCKSKLPNSYYVFETLKLSASNTTSNSTSSSATSSANNSPLNLNLKSTVLTNNNGKSFPLTPKSTSPPTSTDLNSKENSDHQHSNSTVTPSLSVVDTSSNNSSSNNQCISSCNLKFNLIKSQNEELSQKLKIEKEKRQKLEKEIELLKNGNNSNNNSNSTNSGVNKQLLEIYEEIYELWNYYERRMKWKELIEKDSKQYLDLIKLKMEQFSNQSGFDYLPLDDNKSIGNQSDSNGNLLSVVSMLMDQNSENGSYLNNNRGGSLNSSLNRHQLFNGNNENDLEDLIEDNISNSSQISASSSHNNPLSPKKPVISHTRSVSNPIPILSKLKLRPDSNNSSNGSQKDGSITPKSSSSNSADNDSNNNQPQQPQKSQKIFKIFNKKHRTSGQFKALNDVDMPIYEESTSTPTSSSLKSLSESIDNSSVLTSSNEHETGSIDESVGSNTNDEFEKSKVRKKLGKALKTMINNKEKEKEKEKEKDKLSVYTSAGNLSSLVNNGSGGNTPNGTNTPKKKIKLFGTSKKESTLRVDIIEKLINHIDQNGVDVEGIFRLSGNMDTVKTIVKSFNHLPYGAADLNLNYEIHNITNALKHYLRALDPPLIPYDFFVPLLDSRRNEDIQTIRNIFWKLPNDNRFILTKLVALLVKISLNSDVNKMNYQNLSIMFGPTVLKPRQPTLDRMSLMNENQLQCGVMQSFIEDFDYIFQDNPTAPPKSFSYEKDTYQQQQSLITSTSIIDDDTSSKKSTYSTPSSPSSPPPTLRESIDTQSQ
ncbi:Kelch repeat-containing protein [Tieghemostelium lacteum]|uniref:Kelch repeat-containing protein n=1 Tax=Tieghemostelium lacteum TaxID=361077 RepID=A0A151ZEG5_TIELA|nr:Kelch repeat-containing protein [Tieghemostelium lacteum]|eukprot:KYQ92341.1 Kelch repeat-containing protein [Tieghemostelium lacteum]